MTKSSKLYKDSPKIEKDEDGKPGIKKPSSADAQDMGTEGNPLPGAGDGMPVEDEQVEHMHDRHARETKDMHKRHQDEQKDMHKRHLKEVTKHKESKKEEE